MTFWQEKVVLITGAAAGLGRCLATHFARAGAHVVLADRDETALPRAARELAQQPSTAPSVRVLDVLTDITNDPSVEALFAATDHHLGRLDALINCAGRSDRGAALETPLPSFTALLELNLLGTVRCSRAAAPRLLRSQGHLVNIGSLAAKMAAPYLGAYPVSKFAVAAYTHQLRLELGPQGVHVLLVCPGPIAREDAGQRYADQTKNLPASANRPGGGVRLKGLNPDELARRILRACERRRPELVIPAKARLLAALLQLHPAWADRIILRKTR